MRHRDIHNCDIRPAASGRLDGFFPTRSLGDNFQAFMSALLKAKPATSKGVYLRSVTMSSTMGPGVRMDLSDLAESQLS